MVRLSREDLTRTRCGVGQRKRATEIATGEDNAARHPRVWMLLWIACMAGLVGLGRLELGELVGREFPGNDELIHIGTIALFGMSVVQVSVNPFFEEIGKKLK